MLSKLKAAIDSYSMLAGAQNVLVALSGGADSVALLVALNEISNEYNIELSAIHVNHNLRGDESYRDEIFCRDLCNAFNIPLVVESVDVASACKDTGESVELCARNIRYHLFNKHSKGLIATAHTASDNAETVIYNLCRGSGITGICGIPPVRDNIIRPLINCSREDILGFLKAKGQPYVVDSSNNSDDYTRNKIRHNIIPELLNINTNLFETIKNNSILLRQDDQYLNNVSAGAYSTYYKNNMLLREVNNLSPAILSRVLSLYYKETLGIAPDFNHISQMQRVAAGEIKRCSLPKNSFFESNSKGYCISKTSEGLNINTKIELTEESLSEYFASVKKINAEQYKNLINVYNLLFKFSIDCDKIQGNVILRTRNSGDKYRPVGRKITKSLRKLLSDSKATMNESNSLLLLCDDNGIFYSNLFGIDQRVVVDESSKNIMVLCNMEGNYA